MTTQTQNNSGFGKYIALGILIVAALFFVGGYNGLVSKDQTVEQAWSQVQTQYQRRSDLIPNLVSTVKGEANFEKSTLQSVIEARASATQIKVDANTVNNPEQLAKYQQAQGQLGAALGKLLMVTENYPTLKTNAQFAQLMDEIAGTENRIAVARRDFNKDVQEYNVATKSFPGVVFAKIFNFNEKSYFKADEGSDKAPQVSFQ
jgi:LemA protein